MRTFLFCIVFIVLIVAQRQMQIDASLGVGVRGTGIQLQELWRDGNPYYMLYNSRDSSVVMTIGEYDHSAGDRHNWKARYKDELMESTLSPNSISTINVSKLIGNKLVYLDFSGEPAGVIHAPLPPRFRTRLRYATYGGLNVGGATQHDRVWFEHWSMSYAPDATMTVFLVTQENCGKIGFGPYVQLLRVVNRKPDLEPKHDPGPILQLIDIECKTLPIDQIGEVFIVDSSRPTTSKRLHRVKLKFRVPDTNLRMAKLCGFQWFEEIGGSGRFLTRGVSVKRSRSERPHN